jgi:hypothetical protein
MDLRDVSMMEFLPICTMRKEGRHSMDVRWKRKRLKRAFGSSEDSSLSLNAGLVSSHRIAGRPRPQYLRHLGTIRESCVTWHWHACDFWKSADAALATVALQSEERVDIERQLAARVPGPTGEPPSPGAAERRISPPPARD